MKNRILLAMGLIIAMLFVSLNAGNTNKTATRNKKVYDMVQTDTVAVAQGNSITVYSSGTVGIPFGDLEGPDSLWVIITGYGDADTTQLRVDIQVNMVKSTWTTIESDTITFTSTTAQTSIRGAWGIKGQNVRVILTGYGTTDTSHIEDLKIK